MPRMANDREPAPVSGWWLIALGVMLGALGGFLLSTDGGEVMGMVVLSGASLFAGIGAIAVGVTMGFERADYLRQR